MNVSTCAIHDFEIAAQHPNYSASKSAGTILLQQVAKGVSADDMQVVSFHPGAIFTSAAKDAGHTETTMKWDDGKCYLQLPYQTRLPASDLTDITPSQRTSLDIMQYGPHLIRPDSCMDASLGQHGMLKSCLVVRRGLASTEIPTFSRWESSVFKNILLNTPFMLSRQP